MYDLCRYFLSISNLDLHLLRYDILQSGTILPFLLLVWITCSSCPPPIHSTSFSQYIFGLPLFLWSFIFPSDPNNFSSFCCLFKIRNNLFLLFKKVQKCFRLVLVRYSIYRSIAILVNVRYRYLMVSRYLIYRISNDQTILGRYIVRSGISSHSILKQPSIWKHCLKTSISRYLLLIVRLSIRQTSILVSSIAKRFLVILKYRRTESIVHLPSNS